MTAPKPTPTMVSVYDGTTCIGHVLASGPKHFEAFDRDDKSIGIFERQRQAASALLIREGGA